MAEGRRCRAHPVGATLDYVQAQERERFDAALAVAFPTDPADSRHGRSPTARLTWLEHKLPGRVKPKSDGDGSYDLRPSYTFVVQK